MEETTRARCPLCKSENIAQVHSFNSEKIIAAWERQLHLDVTAEFHSHEKFELSSCGQCGLQFFTPDDLAGSSQLYSQLEESDWYYQKNKWEYEVALEDLKGCKNALEVGCGSGHFMVLAKEKLGIEIEGMEQNVRAIEEARRRGLRILTGSLEQAREAMAGKYDAICSFQVLEHVSRPGDFIEACCSLLRAGGKLLLGVPNAESFLRHQFNLLDMPPHHMSRWSAQVFLAFSKIFPLGQPQLKLEPLAEYHIEDYLSAYGSAYKRSPLGVLTHPGVRDKVGRAVRAFGLQKMLRGQSIYASYERIAQR